MELRSLTLVQDEEGLLVQDVRELGSLDSQGKEDRSTDGGLGQLYNDEWVCGWALTLS